MDELKIIKLGLQNLDLGAADHDPVVNLHKSGLFSLYRVNVKSADGSRRIAVKVMDSISMARTELEGLHALRENGCRIPDPYGVYEKSGKALLFMEFIEPGRPPDFRGDLLENLKRLYSTEYRRWGWRSANFIGNLPQPNGWHDSFTEFWWRDRIEPQLRLAVSKGRLPESLVHMAEEIVARKSREWHLDSFSPRMIHGDLWSGNILASKSGVYLLDPSAAIGHPEQDLAMLDLFGSPLRSGDYEDLCRMFGSPEGFVERMAFWQLYPLLVHTNIFGGSYATSVERVLREYA